LTASWKTLARGFEQLEASHWQGRFRAEVLKKFAPSLGITGESLSEQDVEKMFKALDIKQTGVLELDEIVTAFQELDVPDKHIRHIFESADLDGSGVIRFDEFRALMSRHVVGDGGGGDGDGLRVKYLQNRFKDHILSRFGGGDGGVISDKDKLREIFNAIDVDGTGTLNPHEIRVVLRSAGEPEDAISRIIASLDSNQDGGVVSGFIRFLNHMSPFRSIFSLFSARDRRIAHSINRIGPSFRKSWV